VCRNLYDTNIAARFAGLERVGLAALLEDVLDVHIPKDERIQRADWSKRPLGPAELAYAVGDVSNLVALGDAIDQRVRSLGREEWVAEECERLSEVRYTPPDPEWAFMGVRDSRRLDGRGLAVLKSLYAMREAEARHADRPTAFVVPEAVLLHLAQYPTDDLATVPGLSPGALRRYGHAIRRALREGMASPPITRPPSNGRGRPTPPETERLRKLKDWRNEHGKRLALDPSLLWSMRSLERLAREPQALDAELSSPDVRRWQRREFGDSLRAVLTSI
jgi:ribonuclease D